MEVASPREGYLQIGDAAELLGLTQRTLRFYEEKGLLQPPTRMEGGFRLYSAADIGMLTRITELKSLLGFSLAEIKNMLEAEDVQKQVRAGWREDADASEKAAQIRRAREVTSDQIDLINQKVDKLAAMRAQLTQRLEKYDNWLHQEGPRQNEA